MVGVLFRPNRQRNFTALGEQQGASIGVEGPVALALMPHSPCVLAPHGDHHLMQLLAVPLLPGPEGPRRGR